MGENILSPQWLTNALWPHCYLRKTPKVCSSFFQTAWFSMRTKSDFSRVEIDGNSPQEQMRSWWQTRWENIISFSTSIFSALAANLSFPVICELKICGSNLFRSAEVWNWNKDRVLWEDGSAQQHTSCNINASHKTISLWLIETQPGFVSFYIESWNL